MLRGHVDENTTVAGAGCDAYLDYTSLVGLEVFDERGNHLGHLSDANIDPDSLAVTAYALLDTGWRQWLGLHSEIGPKDVTSWSRELMLIKPRSPEAPSESVADAQPQAPEGPPG
jgi:sporulation protein YlmC with PRC-barrel domain